jgi:hypothetical protein
MRVSILGTKYEILQRSADSDPDLRDCDGYCDKTIKRIVVTTRDANCNLGDFESYRRKVLRHEIIHAFLFESGLHENFMHSPGHDETYVDWFAAQYPKIKAVFSQAGCDE